MGYFQSVKRGEKITLIMTLFLFIDSKTIENLISSKKKVLENDDCDDNILTKSRMLMTRTVITLMVTTLMILIEVIRIIMNIENDNDEKKIQQATVDNNLALRTLDQLRDLISLF